MHVQVQLECRGCLAQLRWASSHSLGWQPQRHGWGVRSCRRLQGLLLRQRCCPCLLAAVTLAAAAAAAAHVAVA